MMKKLLGTLLIGLGLYVSQGLVEAINPTMPHPMTYVFVPMFFLLSAGPIVVGLYLLIR